jgi:hypothetical protein
MKPGTVVHTCNLGQEDHGFKASLNYVSTTCLKKKNHRTEGVAQAVECLLCNHKALSSNPRPTNKNKKKSQIGVGVIARAV